ncbi:hypothetical protein GCM10009850_078980 [Nonomuraea monospora]|uniref:Uncharacterized protein n=1 Tax=Nonomuraea monospora TaxID=568818 RepID=A0ABN3CSK9_9ACTN
MEPGVAPEPVDAGEPVGVTAPGGALDPGGVLDPGDALDPDGALDPSGSSPGPVCEAVEPGRGDAAEPPAPGSPPQPATMRAATSKIIAFRGTARQLRTARPTFPHLPRSPILMWR